MLVYLLKSSACLAILLVFYKLLLEKENIHVFKRFFLVGSLVASFVIPALVLVEHVETVPSLPVNQSVPASIQGVGHVPQQPVNDMEIVNWSLLFWSLYAIGLVLFGFRFVNHLYQIIRRIQKNTKQRLTRITHVLHHEKMPPHTFFRYIFLNKIALEKNTIPNEVLLHEETHAKQYHSLDVLFIELLHLIFWFNPLFLLYKRSIKLNHEFLADHKVLKENVDAQTYQNTLLSYLMVHSNTQHQPVMANAINYSSIKKRFTVMRKETSKTALGIRSILLLPLISVLIFGFSERKIVSIDSVDSTTSKHAETNIPNEELGGASQSQTNYSLADLNISDESMFDFIILSEQAIQYQQNVYTSAEFIEEIRSKINDKVLIHGTSLIPLESEHPFAYLKNQFAKLGAKNIQFCRQDSGTYHRHLKLSPITRQIPLETSKFATEHIEVKINRDGQIWVFNRPIQNTEALRAHLKLFNTHLSKEQRTNKVQAIILDKGDAPKHLIQKVGSILEAYGVATIEIHGPSKNNVIAIEIENGNEIRMGNKRISLEKLPYAIKKRIPSSTDIGMVQVEIRSQERLDHAFLNQLTTKIQEAGISTNVKVYATSYSLPENLYADTIETDAAQVTLTTDKIILTSPSQEGVTKAEIKEYNAMAKKYNAMEKNNYHIIGREIERMKSIYDRMTQKQRAKAEPLPSLPAPPPPPPPATGMAKRTPPPPPPPPIPEDATPEQRKKYQKTTEDYYRKYGENTRVPPPPPPIPEDATPEQRKKYQKTTEDYYRKYGENTRVPPPPPPDPLDHIIDMAKQGAIFYYKDQKITSDEAIALLKKNKSLSVRTIESDDDVPVVQIKKHF